MRFQGNFFYCYDQKMLDFLRYKKGIKFNCKGLHEKTLKRFYQFTITEELQNALKEWVEIVNKQQN